MVSILGHGVGLYTLSRVAPYLGPPERDVRTRPVSVVVLEPPPEEEEEKTEEEEEIEDEKGQIVDIAPPEEEERPEDAEYLAEHDVTVEEETRTDKFEVNPDVLAKQWSKEQKYEKEDLVDLNVEKESSGATVGNDRFTPEEHGELANVPSPWAVTNKEGLQDPVPSAHASEQLAGAPNNDLLREKKGEALNINAKEYLYAGYLNRIRRLVNYYWQQNIDNMPASVQLSKPAYTTGVNAVLNSDGALEYIEVVKEAGVGELDDCVVRAFRMAGPFPNPPEGLVEKDGRVYLPNMDFTVQLSAARAQYQGIDPRAGVQFPGILKSPR